MKKLKSIMLLTFLGYSILGFSQVKTQFDKELAQDKPDNPSKVSNDSKSITLMYALEMGLRRNNDQRIRNYTLSKIELQWQDDFYDFWVPKLQATLSLSDHKVQTLSNDNSIGNGSSQTPNGSFSVGFDEFTVFNWGRDYLEYLNTQTTYNRQKQSLKEERRLLRFNLIDTYFNLVRIKTILRARKDQLRHTSFIYRLAKEKLTLKKITSQEYLQTKEEYLRAQSAYNSANNDVVDLEQALARLLGDGEGMTYRPTQSLLYRKLTPTPQEALKLALTQSPKFRDAKTNLANTSRTFKKTLKDNLPLPTFSLNLGAYKRDFGETGINDGFSTSKNNRNIEIKASVDMTWTIFGSGGLFNSRTREKSFIDKRIAEIEFVEAKRDLKVDIQSLFRTIRYLESKVEATQMRLKNARLTFDQALDNYIASKTSFPNIKLVIDALISSEIDYQNAKFLHLSKKLELSDLMGLEDFPGENFEQLVEQ